MINYTLFRPRDLILFFKPLENGRFVLPLKRENINSLVDTYSGELAKEIKNELASFYTNIQVETIFNALAGMYPRPTTYVQALSIIESNCRDVDGEKLLDYLFDRSVIGTLDGNGWYWFKCRQPLGCSNPMRLDRSQQIVLQYGIRTYVRQRCA